MIVSAPVMCVHVGLHSLPLEGFALLGSGGGAGGGGCTCMHVQNERDGSSILLHVSI